MALEDEVKAPEENKTSRVIESGSFEKCYGFLLKRDYEPFSSDAESITFKSAIYEGSWGRIVHVPPEVMPENITLMYKDWKVVLYNHNPEKSE